jgi:glucokinase
LRHAGLDLGGSFVKWVVLENDEVAAHGQLPTQAADGPEAVVDRVIAAGREAGAADTVGIGVPGLFDADGSVVLLPNLPGEWKGRALAGPVREALRVPVTLVNDARAFALAEWSLGAARGCDTAIFLAVGTGVGGGVVVAGRPFQGRDGRAGEIGHVTVAEDGPRCGCGNRGCVEPLVQAALAAGDLDRAGRLLALAVAAASVLLTPDLVVVGGGVAEAGERLLAPLRDELALRVFVSDPPRVVPAELGVLAGAIGAALRGAGR